MGKLSLGLDLDYEKLNMFKLQSRRAKIGRHYISATNYIKDERGDLMTREDVADRGEKYFDDLLSAVNPSYFKGTASIVGE